LMQIKVIPGHKIVLNKTAGVGWFPVRVTVFHPNYLETVVHIKILELILLNCAKNMYFSWRILLFFQYILNYFSVNFLIEIYAPNLIALSRFVYYNPIFSKIAPEKNLM
jgi:hypothetical protein